MHQKMHQQNKIEPICTFIEMIAFGSAFPKQKGLQKGLHSQWETKRTSIKPAVAEYIVPLYEEAHILKTL